MSERLKDRIIEHYLLQQQYTEGVSLPSDIKHLMFDSPPYLEEDYLFTEAEIHLEGVPIFTVKVFPYLKLSIFVSLSQVLCRPICLCTESPT